jgi:hypothetical protein
MEKRHGNKIKVFLISTLLAVGLVANPARADHEHPNNNLIAPLAGLLVLGALLRHNDYSYKRSKRYYGHNGHHHNHGYNHKYRTRSYSSEGYGRKSKRIYRH